MMSADFLGQYGPKYLNTGGETSSMFLKYVYFWMFGFPANACSETEIILLSSIFMNKSDLSKTSAANCVTSDILFEAVTACTLMLSALFVRPGWHLSSWKSVCHGWCTGNKSRCRAGVCTQHLHMSAVVLANKASLSLSLSFSRNLGLDWFSLTLPFCFSRGIGGRWFLAVQARPAAVSLDERQRRSRARERSPIWLSQSVNTKGRWEKDPHWGGKWMALTSSNLRKHLHSLIKIEWKKVILAQERPSKLKLIKCTSLHCTLYLSNKYSQDRKEQVRSGTVCNHGVFSTLFHRTLSPSGWDPLFQVAC